MGTESGPKNSIECFETIFEFESLKIENRLFAMVVTFEIGARTICRERDVWRDLRGEWRRAKCRDDEGQHIFLSWRDAGRIGKKKPRSKARLRNSESRGFECYV